MNSRTNRQHDEAIEARIAAGERQYAASFDPEPAYVAPDLGTDALAEAQS